MWMPGMRYAQSSFNQHTNNVNNANVNHLREVRSLIFFSIPWLLCLNWYSYASISYHTFFSFLFLNVVNLARQLCAQIAKPVWTQIIHFPWAGLSFSFSCKKSQNVPFFNVCCTKCKSLIRQYMNKECCFSELGGNEA